jgi:hypothetical protein
MVSGRWLQFREDAQRVDFGDGRLTTAVFVDVMTDGNGERPRKICDLCITLEDLQAALNNVRVKDDNPCSGRWAGASKAAKTWVPARWLYR